MPGTTLAVVSGHKWYYRQARLCDEYSNDFPKTMRWFLRDDNDWVGDFATKSKMLAWIVENGPAWIADYSEKETDETPTEDHQT